MGLRDKLSMEEQVEPCMQEEQLLWITSQNNYFSFVFKSKN